jgi:hypothetical protein
MEKQRRDFLKLTSGAVAGLALARADRALAAWPATGTLAVNPTISNMRVVSCYDTKMMKSVPTVMTFAAENAAVDSVRLQANMDAMAMQLANATSADAAWKAIFRSSKPWASTRVAIKVNSLEARNMARVAVVQKFCTVLGGLGVLPANLIIYDGQSTYAGGTSNYASYFSPTDTTKTPAVVSVNNASLGGTVSAPIPGGSSGVCTADIANGSIDILINIANNKGHDLMGRATLCMKNHFGTFAPKHDINYLFNINKSDAILGGTPVRQQLCFVDSLLANKMSNVGVPDVMPCYLVMGTFAPAVDYLTIKNVREAVMGCTHDAATISSYLTTFGYAATDAQWVVVPPAAGGTSGDGGIGSGGTSGSGDSGNGGTSGRGGAASGGNNSTGGAASGGTSDSGGSGSGGSNATGGAGSGGTIAAGGPTGGGATSNVVATGGASRVETGAMPALGGAISSGTSVVSGSSGCGCDLGAVTRGVRPWSTLLTLGMAVVGMVWRRGRQTQSDEQVDVSKTQPSVWNRPHDRRGD